MSRTRPDDNAWIGAVATSVAVFLAGCDSTESGGQASQPPPSAGAGAVESGGPGRESGIKRIMVTLAKGPNSLTPLLGKELKETPPPWETIQGQAKEYAQLVAEMTRLEPPKGSKESWSKLTADYADSANDLEKAAQAKDKDSALGAHERLRTSCDACHREHRSMSRGMGGGPGGGGPGGFPGGPPPGGPPPGGPPAK